MEVEEAFGLLALAGSHSLEGEDMAAAGDHPSLMGVGEVAGAG